MGNDRQHCPPDGRLLEGMASQQMPWKLILSEWIDNSLGNTADISLAEVSITIGAVGKPVVIKDNGAGCEDPTVMVKLAAHDKRFRHSNSRYGIGGKDSALVLGGVDSKVLIETVHKAKKRTLLCEWLEYKKNWDLPYPMVEPARPGEIGTKITVLNCRKKAPHGKDWDNLLSELGYQYSSAIKNGARIAIHGPGRQAEHCYLKRWELPPLDDVVDKQIDINGKKARVYAGLVKAGNANSKAGLTYCSSYRVILPESAKGCGNHNVARVCGFVELISGPKSWSVGKHKNEIIDADADSLFDSVEAALTDLLRKADSIGSTLSSQAFELKVSERLNRNKAKRGPVLNPGSGRIHPTGTGRKHKRAKEIQDGDSMPGAEDHEVKVSHEHLGKEKGTGEIKGRFVILNLDDPAVLEAFSTRNALATAFVASGLIADSQTREAIAPETGRQISIKIPSNDPRRFSVYQSLIMADAALDGVLVHEHGKDAA